MKKIFLIQLTLLAMTLSAVTAVGDIPQDCLWALSAKRNSLPLEKDVSTPKESAEAIIALASESGFEVEDTSSLTKFFANIAMQIKGTEYSLEDIGASSLNEYYEIIGADSLVGDDRSLQSIYRADLLGEFAMSVLEVVSPNLSERENLSLQNQLAILVHQLERWDQDDWESGSVFMENYGGVLIHFDDYPEMVKSYVDKTDKYNQIEGDSGVIGRNGMRQIVSHNYWPVDLLPHDMKHVHYAFGHPVAISNVFRAARSRNNLRYVMTSALYEAVDRVQYTEETAIIRYYSKERSATIELGLVYSGWVPTRELVRLAEESDTKQEFIDLASKFSNWVPTYSDEWRNSARHGSDFESDMAQMVESFFTHSQQDLWLPYTNYQMNPQIGGSDVDDAEKHY